MNTHLDKLKETADKLGITYNSRIGAEALQNKIIAFEKEQEMLEKELPEEVLKERKKKEQAKKAKAKPYKISPEKEMVMKAKSLSAVKIVNLDNQNTGANTVFSGVCNQFMDIQRVVPLGVPIALEECLINEISERTHTTSEPELDENGKHTGNYRTIAAPTYAVTRL